MCDYFLSMLIFFVCLVIVGSSTVTAKPDDGVKLSKAQIQFSIELFQKILDQDYTKDVVFSPYSVYSSLLIMLLSSTGDTKNILHKVLRFDNSSLPDENYISHTFLHELPPNKTLPYEFISFDRIFDYSNEEKVLSSVDKEKEINDWISLFTKDMMEELFRNGSIKTNEIFIIANVIDFNGTWVTPFKGSSNTPFTLSDGTNVKTEFLSARSTLRIMTDKELDAQVISLPYKGDAISMIIILPTTKPQKKNSPPLKDVVKKLTYAKFKALTSTLDSQKLTDIDLMIPKLELNCTHDLQPIFKAVGDEDLFTKELFLPIYLKEKVKVNQIVHKGMLKVYEKDTVACAATGLVETRTARLKASATKLVETRAARDNASATGLVETRATQDKASAIFIADHPFIYVILNHKKHYIHSMGVLNKPKKA